MFSPELCRPLRERDDLRGADEGEVQRVEEENHVLAAIVGQGDVNELEESNEINHVMRISPNKAQIDKS